MLNKRDGRRTSMVLNIEKPLFGVFWLTQHRSDDHRSAGAGLTKRERCGTVLMLSAQRCVEVTPRTCTSRTVFGCMTCGRAVLAARGECCDFEVSTRHTRAVCRTRRTVERSHGDVRGKWCFSGRRPSEWTLEPCRSAQSQAHGGRGA
jgi:hypothetical protein